MSDMTSKVYDEGYRAGMQKMVANAESNQIRMDDRAAGRAEVREAAVKLLAHNLEIMKTVSVDRGRLNLNQQLEECQALLRIIVRSIGETDR